MSLPQLGTPLLAVADSLRIMATMRESRDSLDSQPNSVESGLRAKSDEARRTTLTVIIAARPEDTVAALASFEEWKRPELAELLVARGSAPAAQRNAAAHRATGELIVFLDDDSAPSPDLLDVYLDAFSRDSTLAACGGPAVYCGRTLMERVAAAVLSTPLVTGSSASRYRPLGESRASDERELILSNLAVRRAAFLRVGGFDELLYPNEENVLLDRLRNRHESVRYEPAAVVRRTAPRSVRDLTRKVFTYGQGRAAQMRRSRTWPSTLRVSAAILAVLTLCAAFVLLPWVAWPAVGLASATLLYGLAIASSIAARHGLPIGLIAAPVAIVAQISYALGILRGLPVPLRSRDRPEIAIEAHRVDPAADQGS